MQSGTWSHESIQNCCPSGTCSYCGYKKLRISHEHAVKPQFISFKEGLFFVECQNYCTQLILHEISLELLRKLSAKVCKNKDQNFEHFNSIAFARFRILYVHVSLRAYCAEVTMYVDKSWVTDYSYFWHKISV